MRKEEWTLEKLATGFQKFHEEHGHYPTALEIDAYAHLPSSRQIQRRFAGGLPALRKQLKLTGPEDFTKGAYSSERARTIGKRAHVLEKTIYAFLIERFGVPFVHREYFFTDDRRTRTDFFIYAKNGNFSVDIFYPKDEKNLIGCLNSKMQTYGSEIMLQYPVIFLMMNDQISGETIAKILENKTKKLRPCQQVMTYAEFRKFCERKTPMS
jgi:hypothetical protein